MTHPRGLSEDEAQAWEALAATVTPLERKAALGSEIASTERFRTTSAARPAPAPAPMGRAPIMPNPRPAPRTIAPGNLDGHRDRKLKAGQVTPDFTLDLHGHGLDAAYKRLMSGIAQARAMDARTILLVTGKPRLVDPADRGTKRGAIRAKVLDWLAASEHGDAIAAIRRAHIRHGGAGALYVVLRR